MKAVFTTQYSVITFATGQAKYLLFALNCARSVLRFNEIKFFIVSDVKFNIPVSLQKNVCIIDVLPEHLNQGTGIKLFIDQYLQTENTLFIDADCLCYAPLKPVFELFSGKNVSVVGNVVPAANWCGAEQAKTILETFGISRLPRFNGGVYYIARSAKSKKIFDTARGLASDYDRLGFQRIHQKWINEEILIAISMVLNHELPAADNGFLMADLYTDLHTSNLNVLTGFRRINNPAAGQPKHRPWYPAGFIKPVIVHFGSSNLYRYPYLSQHLLLGLKAKKIPVGVASLLTFLLVHIPFKLRYYLSGKLRGTSFNRLF